MVQTACEDPPHTELRRPASATISISSQPFWPPNRNGDDDRPLYIRARSGRFRLRGCILAKDGLVAAFDCEKRQRNLLDLCTCGDMVCHCSGVLEYAVLRQAVFVLDHPMKIRNQCWRSPGWNGTLDALLVYELGLRQERREFSIFTIAELPNVHDRLGRACIARQIAVHMCH